MPAGVLYYPTRAAISRRSFASLTSAFANQNGVARYAGGRARGLQPSGDVVMSKTCVRAVAVLLGAATMFFADVSSRARDKKPQSQIVEKIVKSICASKPAGEYRGHRHGCGAHIRLHGTCNWCASSTSACPRTASKLTSSLRRRPMGSPCKSLSDVKASDM